MKDKDLNLCCDPAAQTTAPLFRPREPKVSFFLTVPIHVCYNTVGLFLNNNNTFISIRLCPKDTRVGTTEF